MTTTYNREKSLDDHTILPFSKGRFHFLCSIRVSSFFPKWKLHTKMHHFLLRPNHPHRTQFTIVVTIHQLTLCKFLNEQEISLLAQRFPKPVKEVWFTQLFHETIIKRIIYFSTPTILLIKTKLNTWSPLVPSLLLLSLFYCYPSAMLFKHKALPVLPLFPLYLSIGTLLPLCLLHSCKNPPLLLFKSSLKMEPMIVLVYSLLLLMMGVPMVII